MIFSDLFFLFVFLPVFFLCYAVAGSLDRYRCQTEPPIASINAEVACHRNLFKNFVLVVCSLIFYAWGEPIYVFLMVASSLLNFVAGRLIEREQHHRKSALIVGIVCNIVILAIFKYLGFLASILVDCGVPVAVPHIGLPIGISFYTFQSISYLVDVYRHQSKAQRRYLDLLLYISMFPQLIAGPIVRYDTVAEEIGQRHINANDIADGAYRFLIGLGKKVILANQFSEVADQFLVIGLASLSTTGAWLGILAFTFQIYFDFSGYSDMAIGLGRMLGFHFNENFNHPYCCNSITDFWRRWHISLGSFFRDYVYIPMGGNRQHQALNILVVWFLTGMWHGASWNFILWGVYFGLIVMTEKYTILRLKHYIPNVVLHVYSLVLVVIGWGIFYFDDFSKMQVFFHSFFGQAQQQTDFISQSAFFDHFWLWTLAIVFSMPVRRWCSSALSCVLGRRFPTMEGSLRLAVRLAISLLLLIVSTALLVGATNNAFIYTRF